MQICQESRNETLRFFHIDARHHYAICPTIDTFWFSFDCIKYLELVNNTREPSHQISTDDQDRDQALLDSVEELEVHGFEFLIQPDDARIYKFVDFAGEGVELDVLLSLRSLKRICFTWSSRYTSLFVDDAGRMHTDDVDLVCTEDMIKRFFVSSNRKSRWAWQGYANLVRNQTNVFFHLPKPLGSCFDCIRLLPRRIRSGIPIPLSPHE